METMETIALYTGFAAMFVAGWLIVAVLVHYAAEWTFSAVKQIEGVRFVFKAIDSYKKDKYKFTEAELEFLEKRRIELLDAELKTDEWLVREYKQNGFPKEGSPTFTLDSLRPSMYTIGDHTKICAVKSNGYRKWVVRKDKECLTKQGQWVSEPIPSERDSDFIENTRFDSVQQAIDALNTCPETD